MTRPVRIPASCEQCIDHLDTEQSSGFVTGWGFAFFDRARKMLVISVNTFLLQANKTLYVYKYVQLWLFEPQQRRLVFKTKFFILTLKSWQGFRKLTTKRTTLSLKFRNLCT